MQAFCFCIKNMFVYIRMQNKCVIIIIWNLLYHSVALHINKTGYKGSCSMKCINMTTFLISCNGGCRRKYQTFVNFVNKSVIVEENNDVIYNMNVSSPNCENGLKFNKTIKEIFDWKVKKKQLNFEWSHDHDDRKELSI